MSVYILGISIVLQFTAAGFALRLIRVSGRWRAWSFLAIALTLMGIRRSITFYRIVSQDASLPPDLTAEIIALGISILLLAGIFMIGPIIQRMLLNEKRQHDFGQSIADWYWEMDDQLRFSYFSDRFTELSGVPQSALLGKTRRQTGVPGIDQDVWDKHLATLDAHQQFRNFIHSRVRPDGKEIWISVSGSPVFDKRGIFQGYRGAATDITTQITAERAQKAFEERFYKVFQASPAAVSIAGIDSGELFEVNERWLTITGYKRHEVIGKTAYEIGFWDDPKQRNKLIEKLRHDGFVRGFKATLITKTDERRNFEMSAELIDIDNENRMLTSFYDTTERDLAEEQVRTLSRAIEQSPVTIMITNTEGKIEYVNPRFEQSTGYTADEVMGENPRFLKSGYTSDAEYKRLWALITSGREWRGKMQNLKKNGDLYWENANFSAIKGPDGKITGYMAVKEDITKQKLAEELSTRLGRIVEETLNEIFIFDAETLKFIQVNKGARRNLGYTARELKSLTPVDIKPLFSFNQFIELIKPLRDGTTQLLNLETIHQRKDGTTYDVSIFLQLVKTETPNVFVAIIEDITERKELEASLQMSRKMDAIGQMVGGIAHDFNNILGIVMGNIEIIRRMVDGNETVSKRADTALKGARRGADLTRRLLAFSRKDRSIAKPINLSNLIFEFRDILEKPLPTEIKVHYVLSDKLWLTNIHAAEFENIFINLALNARDAMADGGTLLIETGNKHLIAKEAKFIPNISPGDYVVVRFNDTGTGMSRETIEKAFDPFFSTKETGKGTGLGLSMVYGSVRRAGGEVVINSEIDDGTDVTIYLPKSTFENDGNEINYAANAPLPGGSDTILIVDDEEHLMDVATQHLENLGYKIFKAANSVQALEILERENKIDLMFSDVVMPDSLNGYQLAANAVNQHPELKVLLTSGYTALDDNKKGCSKELSERLNADLLGKPYTEKELALRIRKVLDS
ncbi:MAG: PAS domain S-box protein [Rhodospirillales bacterium]|nr:PAS domain S-box protein [Rhodospirillales bacterium]